MEKHVLRELAPRGFQELLPFVREIDALSVTRVILNGTLRNLDTMINIKYPSSNHRVYSSLETYP